MSKTALRKLTEEIVEISGDYDGADPGVFESACDRVEKMIARFIMPSARDRERARRAAETPEQTEERRRKNR